MFGLVHESMETGVVAGLQQVAEFVDDDVLGDNRLQNYEFCG